MVGLKKTVTYTKISPKLVNPRDLAGNAEEVHMGFCKSVEKLRSEKSSARKESKIFQNCFVVVHVTNYAIQTTNHANTFLQSFTLDR